MGAFFSLRYSNFAALLLAAVACSAPSQPTLPEGPPNISLLTAPIPDDTVMVVIPGGIRVQVRDALGRPWHGAVVTFRSIPVEWDRSEFGVPGVCLDVYVTSSAGSVGCRAEYVVSADSAGQAEVRVQRGPYTGRVEVQIKVKGQPGRFDVPLTILPGPPLHVDIQPHDTVLLVGASYQLRRRIRDYHGNLVETLPQFVVDSPFVTIDPTGTVHALEIGRAHFTTHAGWDTLTLRVSVVPSLTLAGFTPAFPSDGLVRLVTFDTEGRELRTIKNQLLPGGYFDWNPQRQQFAVHDNADLVQVSWTGAMLGPLFGPNPLASGLRRFPHYDSSGDWIFFSTYVLWRARTDGSGVEQLTQAPNSYHIDQHASPSPDGSRVVFSTDRRGPDFELAYLDLVTRQVTVTNHRGTNPRWSPDGNYIAWLDGTSVRILNLATSAVDVLPVNGGSSLDWSPDGRWLVTNGGEADYDSHSAPACCITLIDVQHRRVIPIPATQGGLAVQQRFNFPVFAP